MACGNSLVGDKSVYSNITTSAVNNRVCVCVCAPVPRELSASLTSIDLASLAVLAPLD